MSGGVDSSVTAALLQKQGYNVTGFFMILNKSEKAKEAQSSAQKIAQFLNIPFYALDLSSLFQKKIIDYLVAGYKSGRTPNPCIVCNKEIKFGAMLEKALSFDFDYVATGHYVKLKAKSEKRKVDHSQLFKAYDTKKDQSYFLYTLTQEKLKHLLFPIGDYTKQEVRLIAKKVGLSVYNRKESQDICFLGGEKMIDFLKKKIKSRAGKIMDINTKKELGCHQGLPFYTLGQRQGIGVGGTGPYYVVWIDSKRNILWVSKDHNDPKIIGKELIVKNVNWVAGKEPKLPLKCKVKIRYNKKLADAMIKKVEQGIYKIFFVKSQRAITRGQSAVFYSDEELLGGGIIKGY